MKGNAKADTMELDQIKLRATAAVADLQSFAGSTSAWKAKLAYKELRESFRKKVVEFKDCVWDMEDCKTSLLGLQKKSKVQDTKRRGKFKEQQDKISSWLNKVCIGVSKAANRVAGGIMYSFYHDPSKVGLSPSYEVKRFELPTDGTLRDLLKRPFMVPPSEVGSLEPGAEGSVVEKSLRKCRADIATNAVKKGGEQTKKLLDDKADALRIGFIDNSVSTAFPWNGDGSLSIDLFRPLATYGEIIVTVRVLEMEMQYRTVPWLLHSHVLNLYKGRAVVWWLTPEQSAEVVDLKGFLERAGTKLFLEQDGCFLQEGGSVFTPAGWIPIILGIPQDVDGLDLEVPKLALRGKLAHGKHSTKQKSHDETITFGFQLLHAEAHLTQLPDSIKRTMVANFAAAPSLVPKKVREDAKFSTFMAKLQPPEDS